jgi:CRP/FNR family transcriptional regulator, cyclic AMP receptor protein
MTLTQDRRATLLAAAPLFAEVDAAGMDRIAERAVEVEFAADHVIARQGEIGTGFFVIVSGGARVVRDGAVIARLGPGDFFGELSVLDGRPRVAQVIADGPTTCLALASWDFEAVIRDQPAVALAVTRGLARRLRDLTEGPHH